MKNADSPFPAIVLLTTCSVPAWAASPVDECLTPPAAMAFAQSHRLGPAFRSEVLAATAAANAYNPVSIRDDREYMGGILSDGERYWFTATPGVAGSDQVQARISVPRGLRLVAFWHTHGAAANERQYFSDVDTRLVEAWQLPFYLADHTGRLKVFAPGDPLLTPRMAARLGLPARTGFAAGRAVRDLSGQYVEISATAEALAS